MVYSLLKTHLPKRGRAGVDSKNRISVLCGHYVSKEYIIADESLVGCRNCHKRLYEAINRGDIKSAKDLIPFIPR